MNRGQHLEAGFVQSCRCRRLRQQGFDANSCTQKQFADVVSVSSSTRFAAEIARRFERSVASVDLKMWSAHPGTVRAANGRKKGSSPKISDANTSRLKE